VTSEYFPNDTKYIYICGAGHSGSTLLDLVLGSHSQITSLGEITHFQRIVRENQLCTCGVPIDECEFWPSVLKELAAHGHPVANIEEFSLLPQVPPSVLGKRGMQLLAFLGNLPLLKVLDWIVSDGDSPLARMVANDYALFDAVRRVSGCQAVVDSSKYYLRMKLLYMYRPDHFRAIHLVRDGRAVMASNLRKGFDGEMAVRGWLKANQATTLMTRTMQAGSHIRAKYEEFCKAPAEQLARICDWLGLEYQAQALEFRSVTHHNLGGNRMRFSTEGRIISRETWHECLEPSDLEIFERIGGGLNRQLGYDE
jgi:hypothetical protein